MPSEEELNSFFGVRVTSGRVELVSLRRNNLSGELPPELENLTGLTRLDLSYNKLTGSIPGGIGKLSRLEHLALSFNKLTGSIPTGISRLSRLTYLALNENMLTGSIPAGIGRLTRLIHLGLSENRLTGSIPTEVTSLSRLEFLNLHENNLEGTILVGLGRLSKLTYLALGKNELSGSIPVVLADLRNLYLLDLSDNNLEGTIPAGLGGLSRLTFLALGQNELTGSIPPELGRLSLLVTLDLSNNKLQGAIPVELSRLENLARLRLARNVLVGEVPPALSRLSRLSSLEIHDNALTGELPLSFVELEELNRFFFYGQELCAPLDDEFQAWLNTIKEVIGPNCEPSNLLNRISVDDVTVGEADGEARFTVSLDYANPVQTVRVELSTRDGSATAPLDYVARSATLELAPGVVSATFGVPIVDDAEWENSETFALVLSGAVNAEIDDSEGLGTILDNDTRPVISILSGVRVGEGGGSADFAVMLSAASTFEVAAPYVTMDGTATAGQDYTAQTGTLVIAPGETAATITVPILDDDIREGEETFTVALTRAENAELGNATSLGTILDNEAVPLLSIADATAAEDAGSAIFAMALSGQSTAVVSVDYATVDETATAGADYVASSGTVQFDPGEVEKEIVVPILADDLDEENETFLMRLSGAENAVIGDGEARGTITDDDEALTISIYDGRAMEDAGMLHLPVRLSRTSSRAVSVLFASSNTTAEAGSDYTSSRGIVIFERGSTEGAVAISVQDDGLSEEDESFQVTLSRAVNAAIARGTATGTIVDNDGMPLLRIDDITVSEDEGEAIFVVTLSVPSARVVTAAYRTLDGTAEAGIDYVMASGTLLFAPGEVEKRVAVKLFRDARDWREETFSLALETASNARLEVAVATATIVEEESIEEGVLDAHLVRLMRASASHVVEAIGDRVRWLETDPACTPVAGDGIALQRYAHPQWNPSAGELLSGCSLVATSGASGVWGRGAFTRQGNSEGALFLNADVTTGTVGADYQWTSSLMAGVMLSHSQAAGTFEAFAAQGETRSRLTGAYPYASYRLKSNSLWVLAGLGRGNAEVDGIEVVEADLSSRLVAAGAVGPLASGRRLWLFFEADAFLARAKADERADVTVSRVRAGIESSIKLTTSLRPYLEVALRKDGGDAETGLGLEVGGGVRLARPGGQWRAEVSSRGLVTHAATGFTEWGMEAALRYGAPQGLGPTAEIRPIWGPAQSGGMQTLWRHDTIVDAALGVPGQKRIEVRFGYGTLLKKENGVARPVLAVTLRNAGRDYRIGYEITMQNRLALSASAVSRETANPWQPVTYGLTARAAIGW